MNVQDALKETGKAFLTDKKYYYDGEFIRSRLTDEVESTSICIADMNSLDWQPYDPTPVIRPKEAGELWLQGIIHYYHTQYTGIANGEGLKLAGLYGPVEEYAEVIHNQNGWTLKYSPDPEVMAKINPPVEDAERIVIEGVKCVELKEGEFLLNTIFTTPHELSGKSMTMILETPK